MTIRQMNLLRIFLLSILTVGFISCNDDNDEQPLKLESYQAEVNFGQTKYIAITNWEGDKSKITATAEDNGFILVEMAESNGVDSLMEGLPYVRILGIGNGESSVFVEDEKGNVATVKVKATDELASFKADKTVRLLLNDDTYKINLKEGDSNGGKYTFGREGDIVTFKWSNAENGKSASLVFTETSDKSTFSWDIHTDAVLTLINPDATEKEVVIKLPYLKVIGTQEKPKEPVKEGVYEYVTDKAWILFRLPAKEGQAKGTLGFCVGGVTNNLITL